MGLLSEPQSAGLLNRTPQPNWGALTVKPVSPFRINTQLDDEEQSEAAVTNTPTLIKKVAQGFARSTAAAGAAIAAVPRQIVNTFKGGDTSVGKLTLEPEGTFLGELERNLYGTDKPISFQSEGEDLPYIEKGSAAAPVLGAALSALDLTGAGGAAKKALQLSKALKATSDATEATNILKRAGFADEVADNYGSIFAKTTDDAEISANLTKAQQLQKTSKTRSFVQTTTEYEPELASRVGGQYVPRDTDTLAIKAKNLVSDDINAAESLARTGSSDKAVATAAELIKKYTSDARAATDTATQNILYDRAAEIANTVARTLTEQGRSIQAATILGRLTPEGVVRFAAREIQKYNEAIDAAKNTKGGINPTALKSKVPELTGEQIASLSTKAKAIEEMADGTEKAMAWHELQDEIAGLVPSSTYKKIISVWKAGLLTGIKTSGLNIASNLFHGVSEVVKDVPAAAVDSVTSLFTGKRTLALTGKGTGKGLNEGFNKGWRYLRTGFDERDIGAKLDYHKVNFGKNKFAKAIQTYEESVFKLIGSQDQPFYYGAKARSMMSQAIADAKTKGLKGADAKAHIEQLVENPTDDMLKYATLDAETAVFQQSTALGKLARGVQNLPGGEIAVPFGKTPAGVATQLINYSPAGFIKTMAENIGRGRFDQRLFSQGIGRATVGTGVAYLGTKLYEKGMMSLGWPTSEREREQWKLEGRTPNSILVNGKWRSAATLGPAGMTLVVGGYFQEALKDAGSYWGAFATAAAGAGKVLTEQTFLKGVNQIIDALTDPKRSAKGFVQGLIGSAIPTLVSDVARATDGKERRTPGILDRAQSRVPGARGALEPQIDVFGQENPTESFFETMADPTRPSTASNDPVVAELRRLSEAGFQSTPTLLGDKEGYPKALTPEQNTELWRRAGTLLKGKLDRLIVSPQYVEMDDEQKQKTIDQFTDKAKLVARAEMVAQITLGLSGEDLKKELSRLKAGGLLTKEVLSKYAEIR